VIIRRSLRRLADRDGAHADRNDTGCAQHPGQRPDGLYLMVEGGCRGLGRHSNQSGRMIEEAIEFEQAVNAVLNWVQANSNWGETLLMSRPTMRRLPVGSRLQSHLGAIVNTAPQLPGMQWNYTNTAQPGAALSQG